MATARFTLVALLALGLVVSGAQTAQAVDAVTLNISSATVAPGSTVDLTAGMPVSQTPGTTEQTLQQDIDPAKTKLTSLSDIKYPQGWTLSFSTDGSTFSTTVPSDWSTVRSVKATGPVTSQGTDNGRQISTGSSTQNLVPPAGGFNISISGVDSSSVGFAPDGRIFVMGHHQAFSSVNALLLCFNRDGTTCTGWSSSGMRTYLSQNSKSEMWIDTASSRLWFPTNNTSGRGFGCVSIPAGQTPSMCSGTGFSQGNQSGTYGFVLMESTTTIAYDSSVAMQVYGTKLVATGLNGKVMCLDVAAADPVKCTGPGYTNGLSTATGFTTYQMVSSGFGLSAKLGDKYFVTGSNSTAQYVSCIVPSTGEICAGWTSSVTSTSAGYIAATGKFITLLVLYPTADGSISAICAGTNPNNKCWTPNGTTFTPAASYVTWITTLSSVGPYSSGSITIGSKVYFTAGSGGNETIYCKDAAQSWTTCSGYVAPTKVSYSLQDDPNNPGCLWTAGDTNGTVSTLNAVTGGVCENKPAGVSFNVNTVVPRMGCSSTSAISAWKTFTLSSPSSGSYTTATVKVIKTDGTVVYTHNLSSGSADLSADSVSMTGQNPIFKVEFTGLTATGTAAASVSAVGDAPQLCLQVTAAYPCPSDPGPVGSLTSLSAIVNARGSAVAGGTTTTLTSSTQNVSITPPAASACGSTLSGRAGDAGNGGTGNAVAGVTVTLLDSSGNPVMQNGSAVTTTTDSSGNYSFGTVTPGSYKVRFDTPTGNQLVSSTTVSGAVGTSTGTLSAPSICSGGGTATTISGANANVKAVVGSATLNRATPANIVVNGDFTERPSVTEVVNADNRSLPYGGVTLTDAYYWGPMRNLSSSPWSTVTGWTASGGGTRTYAQWMLASDNPTRFPHSDSSVSGASDAIIYFGNESGWTASPTVSFDANGYSSTAYTFSSAYATSVYGGPAGLSLAQNVATTAGRTYRLQFWVGREIWSGLITNNGIASVTIGSLGQIFFKVPVAAPTRYTLEFVANSSQTNLKFTSWGHLTSAVELALDDVIINTCPTQATTDSNLATVSLNTAAVVNALYSITAAASSDLSSGAWDTNQTISPLANDTASSGATLTPTSVKLCAANETAPSCTLTSKTVQGEGTYTVNSDGTVTFDPLPTFNGTATAVTYQVSDSASNVVSSSFQATVSAPVPSSATADTTTGLKGAAQTVTPQSNDTPGSGITFTNSSVKLCAVGVLPPNCSATSLTNSAGTYSVNATTGVITFTPDPSFTGVAPAITYQVSDSSGQTVSSTYTATVTGVPSTDNETTSGAWNQAQTISLINGDTAGYGTTLTASSVKLCGPSDTSPNCTLTSLTVSGVGTYTVDSTGNVTFTPVASFTGTAAAVTYSVTDSLSQKATGTYTATVSAPAAPTASPEQKAVLPGGTVNFTATISGSTPLASGSQLKTGASGGPAFVCPVTGASSCSATSVVVVGEGTWTMNQTTGVATFVALNSATQGTLTAVSYRVTDVTGQTATSTLTPVVPPAPTASADTSRGAQDTTQFLAILGNDAPGSAAADLAPGSVKLCGVSEAAPNCTLTSKTVAGEGTYTVLSNGVVKFVPVSGYHGTATTQTYQVADNLGQVVSSTLQVVVVPPPFPLANVDTGTAAYGQSVTLRPWLNDAGGVVPAGETAPAPDVVASSIKLCAVGQSAPNCSATTVTTDDGTYVLNTSTGEVVFTPVTGFSGTVTSPVTYQITNNWTGLAGPGTATSLLMPTIAPPGSPLALNDSAETAPMTPITVTPVTNDVNGTGTLVATSIKLCDATEIAPACTQTSVTVREGVFSVNVATGDVTFTPNSLFDVTHPAVVTYAIKDSLNLWTNATITITDPPPASVVNQISNLARTGMSTFGGPLPLTAFVALVGGVSVVFFAHKSRLKPGTNMLNLEFSPEYAKLKALLEKKPSTTDYSVVETLLAEKIENPRYLDGRPD